MIVGSWRYGHDMLAREDMFNVCPREVDWAQGYMLLPTELGSGFVYSWFGDIDNNRLRLA